MLSDANAIASCSFAWVAASTAVLRVRGFELVSGDVHAEKTKNPRPSERGLLHVACRSPALTASDRPRDQLPFAMRSWMCCARLADDGCELIIELWPPSICASFWKPVTRPFWLMPFCFIRSNE
mgnify:CR=1 FL=1